MPENKDTQFRSLKRYHTLKAELEHLVDSLCAPLASEPEEDIHFPFDLFIENDELVVEVEMPGLEKEHLHIEGIDKFVEISGEKDTIKRKYKSCVGLERANGKFKKLIYLEQAVNLQTATATLEDGVLTIRLPLVEEKRGKKQITIN